jgi:hypothetical protein
MQSGKTHGAALVGPESSPGGVFPQDFPVAGNNLPEPERHIRRLRP